MTTGSGDAPTVPDTSIQWHSAIRAIVGVSRFRSSLSRSARQQGLGGLEHLQFGFQKQNEPQSKCDDTLSQASENEETNQASQKALDRLEDANQAAQKALNRLEDTNQASQKALDRLEDTNPEVEVVKLIRDELVKQLDAYGLVLVLLAGITFIAILQPPGSFNNGKLQESVLVSLFMQLATLSFFIACTGLGAVMVGCAQLFRPHFYPKLHTYTDVSNSEPGYLPVRDSLTTETSARQGFIKWLLGCWEVGSHSAAFDDIQFLADICLENVYRVRRTRIYLGVALVLCIAAYICGALAVMVTNDRQRYMLIGAMGAGGVIPIYEICITMKPVPKNSEGSQQSRFKREIGNLTHRHDEGQLTRFQTEIGNLTHRHDEGQLMQDMGKFCCHPSTSGVPDV